MSDVVVTVEARAQVLHVGIARPAKRNAFNLAVLRELSAAYTRLEEDPELRCLLLFGHGDHFSAGLDLAEVGPHVAAGGALFPAGGVDPFGLFGRRRRKPVVAAMQGYCYTVAVELALASEVVVAARDARFTQFEVRRGIGSPMCRRRESGAYSSSEVGAVGTIGLLGTLTVHIRLSTSDFVVRRLCMLLR